MNVELWQKRLRVFADEREWCSVHTPKNLVSALAVEAAELLEIFQWMTAEESQEVMEGSRADDVRDEIADVAIYLLRVADLLDVDLEEAVADKMQRNARRFPVRGRST